MKTLLTDLHADILKLTLSRPERANAFDHETIQELRDALDKAAADATVRCVVLTGAGRSFSAGHDITDMLAAQGQDISYREHLEETYNPLVLQIRRLEKPVIAAINGPVAGAGLGVAMACDLRIAAETASFTVGFNGIGLVPDAGVSKLLPVLIGLGRATQFTFTNQPITAAQALDWGLVNYLVSADALLPFTEELAGRLASGPVATFGLTKRLFNRTMLPDLKAALDYEGEFQEIAKVGSEHIEGVRAFLEKRPPKFK